MGQGRARKTPASTFARSASPVYLRWGVSDESLEWRCRLIGGAFVLKGNPRIEAGLRISGVTEARETRPNQAISMAGAFGCPLTKNKEDGEDEYDKRNRCRIAAQRQTSGTIRFVEKVTDNGAQRSRQNECRPEEPGSGYFRPEVGRCSQCQKQAKQDCSAKVSKSRGIRRPVP